MMQHNLGNSEIPTPLLPFIFHDPEAVPSWTSTQRRIIDDVDVFIIEVSDLRQIRYQSYYFQSQNFVRNFISKYSTVLLPWYRSFSIGEPIGDELVEKALSGIPDLTHDKRNLVESILREARLEPLDVEGVKLAIERLRFSPEAHWIFVSHFVVPGVSGTLMQDRLKLRETLREATETCGVDFFDPSASVAVYGREAALDNGGSDIYHYAKAFQPVIAETLLERCYLDLSRTSATTRSANFAAGNISLQAVASALNALLVSLHRERLAQSSIDESGLYAHYASLLEQKQIVRQPEIEIVNIILRYLPEFDCYHVLRAGLGEISFLLSVFGRKAVAVDPFMARFLAIEAGGNYLEASGFLKEGSWRAINGVFPSLDRRGRVLAVATQLAITVSPEEEENILQELETYDAVLFFPRMLVRPRKEVVEQEALLERFRRAGFTSIREYAHLNMIFCAKDEEVGLSMTSKQPLRATITA